MAPLVDAASSLFPRDGGNPIIIAAPTDGPYTTPSLTANLFCRVFLAIIANLVCLVPMRLLHRNSEFAAVVFILSVEFKNITTIVNSLIWRDDNVEEWYQGYGLCDMGSYFDNFANGVYTCCLLAIMRNLAQQVGLMRANPLSRTEKRRRNLVQALIIFPIPLVQVAMTWPLTAQRYGIGTLVGCVWVAHPSWPQLLVNVIPHFLIPLATSGYALLTYFRYREVAKSTKSALSRNRLANLRAQRTRRRLYLMVISIMVPFLPINILMFVYNVWSIRGLVPYDYNAIHTQNNPYPFNSVLLVTSDKLTFQLMNVPYIAILTAIPIFVFFGTTKDAMNDYRKILLFVGLGKLFPKLNEEYDPDRSARSDFSMSFGSSVLGSNGSKQTGGSKFMTFMSSKPPSSSSSASGSSSRGHHDTSQHSDKSAGQLDVQQEQVSSIQPPPPAQQANGPRSQASISTMMHEGGLLSRNPFLFRTKLDLPVPLNLNIFKSTKEDSRAETATQMPSSSMHLDDIAPDQQQPYKAANSWTDPPGISTRVWSDEERQIYHHHKDKDQKPNRRSVSSTDGVIVETMFTRETENVEAGAAHPQQQQQPR